MKKIYFTVGPSQIYPSVPVHTQSALSEDIFSLNHRGKKFESIYHRVDTQLKQLLSIPEDYSVFFLSSGTEAMERIVQNTVDTHSFHVVTGNFGDRFYHTALECGKDAKMHVFEPTEGFHASDITVPTDAELIAFTHNDTSTGMQIPMEEIYAVAATNPDKLIAIDTVSSMPSVDIDYSKIDCVFFSVQKGFGMPAGLGIVIVSPRAMKKAKQLESQGKAIGSYHNFLSLSKYAAKYQTPDTPNVFGIYLLDRVLADFLAKGIDAIRSETEQKATMLYDYFQSETRFQPLVKDVRCLSQTTLVIAVDGGSTDVQNQLKEKGIIVGPGYGERKDLDIRIANFPAHEVTDVENLINALKNT